MEIPNLSLPYPPLSNPPNPPSSHQQDRPPKMKPIFPKKVTWKFPMPPSIAKYRHKGLSTIQLLSARRYEIDPNSLRIIHKSLKETKRLLSLTIMKPQTGAKNLEQLPSLLNATSRLKMLRVNFDHLTYEEEIPLKKNFKEMLTRFRRFRDLSSLDVSFDTPDETTNRILTHLFKQLKGLTKLRDLSLDLIGCDEYNNDEYNNNDDDDEENNNDDDDEENNNDDDEYNDTSDDNDDDDDDDESLRKNHEPNALIFTSQYPRSLRSLCINFQRSNLPHIEMLEKFALNLSRCHSLESLSLDCSGLSSISNFLAPIFQMTKSLKTLCVTRDFYLRKEIQENPNFATSLQHLKHLTELDLRIFVNFPEDPSKKFVKSLFKHLSSLTNLESLKLELHTNEFPSDDDPKFQEILLNLKSLSRLQKLDLSLDCKADETMTHLQSFFQAFQSFSCLRNFRLSLPPEHKISHQDVVALSLMLKNLNCLRTLNLTFNDTEVGSDSLEILFASIVHFQLSSLLLDTRQKGPDYLIKSKKTLGKDATGIKLLFSTLSNFTFLSSLDLNLSNLDFQATDLKELSLSLEKLKQLTHFSLQLGPQGPRIILPCLKEIPKLASLQLISNEELSDDTVGLLAVSLMDCRKSLKSLDLQFRLPKKSINIPLHGLETLVSLKNLTIKIKRANMFKKKEVIQSLEVLSFLKKLERIVIELPFECRSKDFDILIKKMGDHWNLETFNVNFEKLV